MKEMKRYKTIRRKYTPDKEKETFKKERKIKMIMKIKFVNRNRIL